MSHSPGLTWNRLRYSLYAPVYDFFVRFGSARRRAVELLSLRPEERVLVVGAGTGQDLAYLPGDVGVVAGDVAPGMLRILRRRAERASATVEVRELDAHRLDLPDASFDAVLLHLVLAVVTDPRACIEETVRVTRPGGRVSVFDKFAPDGEAVSWWRRVMNPVTVVLATSVNRQLGLLLEGLPLRIERREPAAAGGLFELVLLRRP